uniref:Uncharacterized protein n=1 Tax=Anguilla anguilla TaxID=7936 RepID=A0A0E9PAB1_ANGAN
MNVSPHHTSGPLGLDCVLCVLITSHSHV